MLKEKTLAQLRGKKNLLAFSAGVDSTALLFLLKQHNIIFDIAIVNYGIRKQSLQEVAYAKSLTCEDLISVCRVFNAPKISNNFESNARKIRYKFFEELISTYRYENLLTAHHLGDRFEWMLMQFCKGAGCIEIAGMQDFEAREGYNIVRPLLHVDKQELLCFLNTHNIKYFEDETNLDENIQRNSFRHKHTNPLLHKYRSGIKKSFEYIDIDREILTPHVEIKSINGFTYFKSSQNSRIDIFTIDKILKSQGYMLSAKERELLKNEKTIVAGRKFIINQDRNLIFIVPYTKNRSDFIMPHAFKEKCRTLKIEPKLRPYLYIDKEAFNYFCTVFFVP
ncbi:MAG: tRNA lysidine(34) synthetase TilS [Campylobacterota bacterium]|nr:tRNA lysidine(34) synthetase TilS [Campylobacterota bacterium]